MKMNKYNKVGKFYATGVQKDKNGERNVVLPLEAETQILAVKEARQMAKEAGVILDLVEVRPLQSVQLGKVETIPTVRLKDRIKAQRAAELRKKGKK
jgi:hypothetical protein